MKFAMRDPRTLALLDENPDLKWTFIAFFFHDRGSLVQKSLLGMLQEIIDSIVQQLPQLVSHAIVQYKQLVKLQRTKYPKWSIGALKAAMTGMLEQRNVRIRWLFFLDALDEHEGDNEELIKLIQGWAQKADGRYVRLKICIASRPWNIFQQSFGNTPTFAIDHYTTEDIRVYTRSRINNAGNSDRLLKEMHDSLVAQIIAKAQGVFIWVRLVTDQLIKDIRDSKYPSPATVPMDHLTA